MNRFLIAFIIIFNIFLIQIVPGQHAYASPIGKHYEYYIDSSKKLTIDDFLSGEFENRFTSIEENYPSFGFTDDVIWLRLDPKSLMKDGTNPYWLEFIDKVNHADIYTVKKDHTYTLQKGGISGVDQLVIDYRSFIYEVDTQDLEYIFLRLSGDMPLPVNTKFMSTITFIEEVAQYKYISGIFYGFMISLALYNLFLFFSLRERAYLYYVFYVMSFILFQLAMNGLDLEYFGNSVYEWTLINSISITACILYFFMILFSKEFLSTKYIMPRVNRILNLLMVLLFLPVLFIPIIDFKTLSDSVSLLGLIVCSLLWYVGFRLVSKGHRIARFYLVAWSILLLTVIIQALSFLYIIPYHPIFFEAIPEIGAALEVIFLSLALADKINHIKREREEAQRLLNEELERIVSQRTMELELANADLEKLSTTDQLTQIFNRHKLEQSLEHAIKQANDNNENLSIILLDIDYFKQVNDKHGHQAGDQVLITFANLIKELIPQNHIFGRWGGEEFLLICPKTSKEEGIIIAEYIRAGVESFNFPVVDRITCSLGVAVYKQGESTSILLSHADKGLYLAKEMGRNKAQVFDPLMA
ncbi:diguanylate cyclase (GGDEF) domain-containing protein [Schinkia azotoformans MEV2011]|uniref:Diguanylate cyclase (GGDEF) domain-containing protein n=1 Tax=Schinkia azotoformans MEV2011 TaxID=1348973 RepID=A0A072NML3_SCHAZ|nr:diguanylate cyclase [Schinkia azotoformans]KEF38502.1 diguanylate cyclase (GGDEF) domain-containing protein [Schinkia azotoformans MEV2011]MEC1695111.1 sensor domain-containing diguanylate cyclase [Schinkia azotoformans]MEC1717681.1 sensor domain-containing diguanylate cyclase [Schinkia azotoformans]MEC1723830.1 sensor domain-containing diguanylate cyclase [Schinkia azotoformans]MEC1742381.1 sensor domain-containing diguanylate cyclase [Schinkia azotoformans]